MKVAFFNHSLRLGSGIDMVLTELASRLMKKNIESAIFCFWTNYQVENHNFEIHEIKSPLANSPTKMAVLAPFLMDKVGDLISRLEEYDVVNTHNFPANYIVRNLRKPLKIVTDWSVGDAKLWPSSLKQRLYVKFLVYKGNRIAAKMADEVLVSSEFIKNWVRMNYAIDPYYMMLNGINFELLDRNKVTSEVVYEKYPEAHGKKIVLYVGRITDHKNIHSLIEAFAILEKSIHEVLLFLVGDYKNYEGYYYRLRELIATLHLENKVIFTGVVSWDDLPAYYSACSIYSTCTLWEGFLRAEYYAFGKPIVCFNTGPNEETVHDRERGFLVKNLDLEDFAEKMRLLLFDEDLARRMGENGYLWAKKILDFNIIVDEFKSFCAEKLSTHD
jgi:glycosyltransferase involved in cell wall biosynthesis